MHYELNSIGVWAFLKVAFFVNLILGFLIGLISIPFVGLFLAVVTEGMIGDVYLDTLPDTTSLGMLIVVLPFGCAVFGAFFYTLCGLVVVMVYNLVAKLAGGLELSLEAVTAIPTPVTPRPTVGGTPPPPPPPAQYPPPPRPQDPSIAPSPPPDSEKDTLNGGDQEPNQRHP